MDLPFADACFDTVLNQDPFCPAIDKPPCLRGVGRPWTGGFLEQRPAAGRTTGLYRGRGAKLAPGADESAARCTHDAGTSGFRGNRGTAIHSTGEIHRTYLTISFLNPHFDKTNPGFQEFMDASVSYASGLSQGLFTYRFISGRRPAQ